MADEAHEVDAAVARDLGRLGVVGAVLEETQESCGLLPDLTQQQGAGSLRLRKRPGHRRARHPPPSRGMNTGAAPDRSRRFSSETRR